MARPKKLKKPDSSGKNFHIGCSDGYNYNLYKKHLGINQQVFQSIYYFPVPAGLPIYVLLSSASRSSNLYTTFQYLQAFLAGEIAKVESRGASDFTSEGH